MTRAEILGAAKKCVCGDRETDYGSPENNFSKIADLWNAYLQVEGIDAVDVAVMLALLKIARIKSGNGKDDNWIDLAGYAACGGEIESGNRLRAATDEDIRARAIADAFQKELKTYSPFDVGDADTVRTE